MNSALIRQLNVTRIFHALREHPGSSQRDLSEMTGLDKATVSAVVTQLSDGGLLSRQPKRLAGRAGRPEVSLSIARDAGIFIGVRLEPTTLRLIATSLDGQQLESLQVEGSRDMTEVIGRLERAVSTLVARCGFTLADVRGLGVGVPGIMDMQGNLVLAPNLGWRDVAIGRLLRERFAVPVYVDNDTKAAALAERLFGACRNVNDFIFITAHSGVGGGLYLGGRLYRGSHGYAGEVGHLKVIPSGRLCACGGRGCLEAYLSERALLQRLTERGCRFADVGEVARAAVGNALVQEVLAESGTLLGRALAQLTTLLTPERIVLGGNLTLVADMLLPAAQRALRDDALPALQPADIIVSPLGRESVPMGGVALALEGFLTLPRFGAGFGSRSGT